MRILITSVVDLKRTAHNRLHEFARHLSEHHHVTILSIRDWWKDEQVDTGKYREGYELLWERVEIAYISKLRISPILQELLSLFTIPRILRKLDRDFDVHLNYNTLVSGFVTAVIIGRRGVPTVYDLADDLPAMIRTSPQIPPIMRPLGAGVAKLMVRSNLMLSEKATVTTRALDIPSSFREKIVVVPNGVATELFKRRDAKELRRLLDLEGSFVLGYVGVLREWVDLEPVFSGLAVLRHSGFNVKVLIVGEEGGVDKAKLLARQHDMDDQVQFAGTVPYPEVSRYISCMDVALIPFRFNRVAMGALPLKLLEYMACEVPVICTRLPGIETLVENRVLYTTNSHELVNWVKLLMENPVLGNRLRAEGRLFVEEHHQWENIVDLMEGTLRDVNRLSSH